MFCEFAVNMVYPKGSHFYQTKNVLEFDFFMKKSIDNF